MYKNYKILCTICARGGSKGIPNKNRVLVKGKPLIAYTFETAKECDYLDDIIVSTDDDEIINIASDFNVSAPFKRPEYLAEGSVPRKEVVKHAVSWAEDNWIKKYDIVVDLSATSPLRTIEDIKNSIELLIHEKADNVFSVSPAYRNPYYNMIDIVDGRVKLIKETPESITSRQSAPVVYDMNDSINVWWKKTLFEKGSLFNENTKIYIMPRARGIDIDEPFDLLIFSLLLENSDKIKNV